MRVRLLSFYGIVQLLCRSIVNYLRTVPGSMVDAE